MMPDQRLNMLDPDHLLSPGKEDQLVHFVVELGQLFAGQFDEQAGRIPGQSDLVRRRGVLDEVLGQLPALGLGDRDQLADLRQTLGQPRPGIPI